MGDTETTAGQSKNEIIESIQDDLEYIDEGLQSAEDILSSLENCDYDEVVEKLSPLDRAKYDLTILYSINSFYWMYLKSWGTDAKSHKIMEEMERIKKVKDRIKLMTEVPASRKLVVDKAAAHRIVKHELWEPKNKKSKTFNDDEDWDEEIVNNTNNQDNEQEKSSSRDEPQASSSSSSSS